MANDIVKGIAGAIVILLLMALTCAFFQFFVWVGMWLFTNYSIGGLAGGLLGLYILLEPRTVDVNSLKALKK